MFYVRHAFVHLSFLYMVSHKQFFMEKVSRFTFCTFFMIQVNRTINIITLLTSEPWAEQGIKIVCNLERSYQAESMIHYLFQKEVRVGGYLGTLVCLIIVSNTRMLFSEISTQHALIRYNTHRGSQKVWKLLLFCCCCYFHMFSIFSHLPHTIQPIHTPKEAFYNDRP